MKTKPNLLRMVAIVLALSIASVFASCGNSQEKKPPDNQGKDSGSKVETGDPPNDKTPSNADSAQKDPGNKSGVTRVFPTIPDAGVEVKLNTQFVSAMAIIPETALTRIENNQDSLLLYSNIGKLAKINGIKKGGISKDKQFFLSYCPSIFIPLSSEPQNQIEDVVNWYWTASHPSTGSFWLAGNMSLDTTLMPAIRDLRYDEKAYPGTGISVYIQTKDGINPKYGKTIVPLGRDLCYFNIIPSDPVLANDTFKNLNIKKTLGLVGKSPIKTMLSLCGDPEQALLVSPRKRASGLLATVPEKMKKDFSDTLANIKDLERHPGLTSVAVCYDRSLDRPLRFVFGYDNKEQMEEDFPKLASIWGKAGKGSLDWTRMIAIQDVYFSKSLTCGILECKPDKKIQPHMIVKSFLMMIQGGFMPELWLR